MAERPSANIDLPKEPIDKVVAPIERFMHIEAASGIVLLAATAVALILANSRWSDFFTRGWGS